MRYRLPAEWEPQSLVMLTWPHQDTDWAPYLDEITRTYVEMADAITQYEKLLVVTLNPVEVGATLSKHLTSKQMARVVISYCKTNDTWARDHGPITLVGTENDGQQKLLCLDFRFNGWGDKFPAELDNKITRQVFKELIDDEVLKGDIGSGNDDFVLEGGSIESDGEGTVFTTECCLMAPNRNQPLTKEEVEQELSRHAMVEESLVLDRAGKIIALVYPKSGVVPYLTEERELTAICDRIRNATNKHLPPFSQIFRVELVDVPFERTAKGTIKRHLYQ